MQFASGMPPPGPRYQVTLMASNHTISWRRRRSRRAPRDSPPGVVQIQAKRPKAPDLSALFLDGFGILALDAEAADQLLEHALKLVTTHGFDGLDLRSSSTAPNQLDGSDEKAGVNLVL